MLTFKNNRLFILLIIVVFMSPITVLADSEVSVGGKTGQAHIILDEGIKLRPRPFLNFTGGGAACSDSGGKTVCDFTDAAGDMLIIDTGAFYDSGNVEGALQEVGRVILDSGCKTTGYSFYNDTDGETGYWCMNGVELASVKFTPTFDNRVVTNGDNRVTTNGDSRRVR